MKTTEQPEYRRAMAVALSIPHRTGKASGVRYWASLMQALFARKAAE